MQKNSLLATTFLTSAVLTGFAGLALPAHAWVITDCTAGSQCTYVLPGTLTAGSGFGTFQPGLGKIIADNQGTRWSPFGTELYSQTIANADNLGGIYFYLGPKFHASIESDNAAIARLDNNGKSDINIFAQTVAGSETYNDVEYIYGLSTTGENSPAFVATHTGSGDINVEYGASLTTSGTNSSGFVLNQQGSGNINFTGSEGVLGSIATTGENATAVVARIAAGTTTIDTRDIDITTKGDFAAGVNVLANDVFGNNVGKITIISGAISTGTEGGAGGINAHGIVIGKQVNGDLNMTAGDIAITALGDITTNGLSARGIWAQNNGGEAGDLTINTTAASIATKGVGETENGALSSDGIYAQAGLGNVDVMAGNI